MTQITPTSLILILISPLIIIILVYLVSRIVAPKPRKSKDRDAPYACGEYLPPIRPRLTINFFWYVVIFLIFDVIDFLLALSYGVHYTLPLLYVSIVLLSLLIALTYR